MLATSIQTRNKMVTTEADLFLILYARPNPEKVFVISVRLVRAQVINAAISKRQAKRADWIVANDVSGDVMGGDSNRIHFVTEAGAEDWERMSKAEVARRLAGRIADALG